MSYRNRPPPTRPDPELVRLLGRAVGAPVRGAEALGEEEALRQLRLRLRTDAQSLVSPQESWIDLGGC